MDDIHPDKQMRKECNGGKHAKQSAMVAGLVEFQDEYYREVSQYFGHSRITKNPKTRPKYAFWQTHKSMNSKINNLKYKLKGLFPWRDMTTDNTPIFRGF